MKIQAQSELDGYSSLAIVELVERREDQIRVRISRFGGHEFLEANIEYDESVFQYLLSIKGQRCKLEGTTAYGQEFTWE